MQKSWVPHLEGNALCPFNLSTRTHGWLVVFRLPLWKIWKSIGMVKFPTYRKLKNVPNHQPNEFRRNHVPNPSLLLLLCWSLVEPDACRGSASGSAAALLLSTQRFQYIYDTSDSALPPCWLVPAPLKHMSQLEWWNCQLNGKHVPNHHQKLSSRFGGLKSSLSSSNKNHRASTSQAG